MLELPATRPRVLDSRETIDQEYFRSMELNMHQHIPFVKMSGAGNDFIIFAVQDVAELDHSALAVQLCTRGMSVGADGVIVVTPGDEESVTIRFFNPDGSLAEMCGNGSRCAARYAWDNRLVKSDAFSLGTDSGRLQVQRQANGEYRVVMPPPKRIELDYLQHEDSGLELAVDAVRVGVPHCVVQIESLDEISDTRLVHIGRTLRQHDDFPDGVNVNFVEIRDDGTVRQRTYERGVENLTKACGTGATAIASVLMKRGLVDPPLELEVDGGQLLITVENNEYWLSGDARMIYTGVLHPEASSW
jgi:diaminopimelate epimerase